MRIQPSLDKGSNLNEEKKLSGSNCHWDGQKERGNADNTSTSQRARQ